MITVENILDVQPLDLSFWIQANVLNIRIPKPGPNHTLNIQNDILPILADIANREAIITEFYVVVVGATPTQTAVRSNKETDVKAVSEVMGRKKDILYRTLQTLEAIRETASRMMTGAQESRFGR